MEGIHKQDDRQNALARRIRLIILFAIAVISVLLLLFLMTIEGYFPPNPAIDTRFPPGYSEKGFDQIQIGDSREHVRSLIGAPFDVCDVGSSDDSYWCYSLDGAFCCWDFAWLYRAVTFDSQGRVSAILRAIHYD